jgi:hypothetical protein
MMTATPLFVGAACVVALSACSSGSSSSGGPSSQSPADSSFVMPITVVIEDDGNGYLAELIIDTDDEDDCRGGPGPYEALTEGETVTVRDAEGAVVGLATLPVGQKTGGFPISCTFTVSVSDVPDTSQFYAVQVGALPEEQFAAAQAREGITITYTE